MPKKPRKHYDIVEYEPWMVEQIARLNVLQYGGTEEEKRGEFARITQEPFARDKGVAICALDGDTLVGVQTYRYWPYLRGGERYYSLQSGGTLVHPDHRGQGLFMRMLSAGNDILAQKGVDFLTGFPVPMSFGGFIKDDWHHVDSPMWFLRPLRPVKMVVQRLTRSASEPAGPHQDDDWSTVGELKRVGGAKRTNLCTGRDFLEYRYGNGRSRSYDIRRYDCGEAEAVVVGKRRSSNGFAEYVIGDILSTDGTLRSAHRALSQLLDDLRNGGDVAACSILVGTGMKELYPLVARFGFLPTFRKGLFIAKAVSDRGRDWLCDRWQWNLMHADIDTW